MSTQMPRETRPECGRRGPAAGPSADSPPCRERGAARPQRPHPATAPPTAAEERRAPAITRGPRRLLADSSSLPPSPGRAGTALRVPRAHRGDTFPFGLGRFYSLPFLIRGNPHSRGCEDDSSAYCGLNIAQVLAVKYDKDRQGPSTESTRW